MTHQSDDKIDNILEYLSAYYDWTRRTGHTNLMLEGAKHTKGIVVIADNYEHGKELKQKCDNAYVTTIHNLPVGLNGAHKPIAFDNAALRSLFSAAAARIHDLKVELRKVKETQTQQTEENMSKPEIVGFPDMDPDFLLNRAAFNPASPSGMFPEDIVAMEAQGQQELVNSEKLPLVTEENRGKFEELGFEFGAQIDDLFQEAKLPEGWKREGSDHNMWSYIVDERGFRRAAIFYKAAPYDRDAFMYLEREPKTKAQEQAYNAISEEYSRAEGYQPVFKGPGKEGDNVLYRWGIAKKNSRGDKIFDRDKYDAGDDPYEYNSLVTVVVDPEGNVIDRRWE